MFSTISPVSRSQKRAVTAATWGLTSTRGWRQKAWPGGSGSAAKTSSAAPRSREASSAPSSAGSSKSVPRDTFTTMASCGSRSSTTRLTAPRVSAVWGAAITKQSLSVASRGRSPSPPTQRSEEHTSELQSRFDLVCRLLLEKKKKIVRDDSLYEKKEEGGPA